MEKYKDIPMDFADASLVAAAERLGTNKIFTLDSDFYIYRINGRKHFEIIP
jgi:predicted nucleic acid-binding protein